MTEEPLPPEEADPGPPPEDVPLAGSAPPSGAPLPRRLRRRVNGSIGGVASGVADYFAIDPVIVRLAFVVAAIVGSGGGIFLYAAGWLLLPDQSDQDPRPVALNDNLAAIVFGTLAVVAAVSATFGTLTFGFDDNIVVAMLLGAGGFYLLNQRAEAQPATGTQAPGSAMPNPPADPRAGVRVPSEAAVPPSAPVAVAGSVPPPAPIRPSTWSSPPTSPSHWATPRVDTTSRPAGPKPPVTSVTLALAALAVAIVLAAGQLFDADIGSAGVFGVFATICGFGLISSAFIGRARPLIPIGLLALGGLALAPLVDTSLAGGFGPREYVVSSADDLRANYEVGGGYIALDMRRLQLNDDRTVEIDVGGGYTEIVVPYDLNVIVQADSGAGYVEVFGREQAGVNASLNQVGERLESDNIDGPTLTIKANVTFGYVEVKRG